MRFEAHSEVVIDTHTGLMWTKNASKSEYPMTWSDALVYIKELNSSKLFGYSDWKLPNRRELFSIISHKTINPCLPSPNPFINVFPGYYWTSTTCARLPDQAWYIHLGGGRVFKGMKHGSYMVWPVRMHKDSQELNKFQTGQYTCYDKSGTIINCSNTVQDGEFHSKVLHKSDRFECTSDTVRDKNTGLIWMRHANIHGYLVDWETAFGIVSQINIESEYSYNDWRLPTIIELDSLTDMSRHSPALPLNHPFTDIKDYYWSSNTSMYDTHYAWVMYLVDGAIGVGYKPKAEFFLWLVRGKEVGIA